MSRHVPQVDSRAVAAQAASLLLRYPDRDVLAALPTLRAALAGLPSRLSAPLSVVADHHAAADPAELAEGYVATFDFRRRCCLYLTYWTHGDTRARGQALAGFAEAYRSAGVEIHGGELPDHLPTVLEFAAICGEPGWRLLRDHRVGVDLLAAALERDGAVYRHAVEAVRRMLPAPARSDLAAAAALAASGPPAERVGLAPYGSGGAR